MVEINVIKHPTDVEDFYLRNKVRTQHLKQNFLKNMYFRQLKLLEVVCREDKHSSPRFINTLVDLDHFHKAINGQKYVKLNSFRSLIKPITTISGSGKGAAYVLGKSHWISGMANYKQGKIVKYALTVEFVKTEHIQYAHVMEGD